MIRRLVVVRGRVQGVMFRASCAQEAARRSVSGWVSNEPDGSVAAVFEGEPDDVAAMVAWCRVGPRFAVVERVDVTDVADEAPRGEHGFDVR